MRLNLFESIRHKYIGDRNFYKYTIRIMLPIVIQNGITQFVNLLDNLMVGQIGTEPMTGVSIANQLIFVFTLCIFGAVSGAGIFGAQFAGKADHEGMRSVFRFKVLMAIIISAIGLFLFITFPEQLIALYLKGEGEVANIEAALSYGKEYLAIMTVGLVPFSFVQVYSSSLREFGETLIPMKAGVAAILTNLVGNYILIFGKFGAPALGAAGAAIATVISRFVEVAIVAVYAHSHTGRFCFIKGAYRTLKIPADLFKRICKKGSPILVNEMMLSLGMSTLVQCYSLYSYDVMAAVNISQTIGRLFDVAMMAFGSAIAIIVGQILGTGDMKKAKDTDTKLIAFAVSFSLVTAALMALLSPLIAGIYNVTPSVHSLAVAFLRIVSLTSPIRAFIHTCYFTLRSGGKTFVTLLFDSVFVWTISVSSAYCLTHFTQLHIITIYVIIQLLDLIKCITGFILVKKGVWLKNIVNKDTQ